jgi:hypothetical protein
MRSKALVIFSSLLELISLEHENQTKFKLTLNGCTDVYEEFFREISMELFEMLNYESKIINNLDSIFQIVLVMVYNCPMEFFVRENYITGLFKFLNTHASFDIKTYLLVNFLKF